MAELHNTEFKLGQDRGILFLTLVSGDGMNRLTRRRVVALQQEIESCMKPLTPLLPLVISGAPNFSAGADLNEIKQLSGADALMFANLGQELMGTLAAYPAPVYACIHGFCMGGGLDLALPVGWLRMGRPTRDYCLSSRVGWPAEGIPANPDRRDVRARSS